MKKNFFSILITNYNKEQYLDRCIRSLLNQNFNNFEIILFDDCSTDNSIYVIKKYRKVKLIKNKIKKRNYAPLNQIRGIIAAFKQSKGNIICLMDADDFFKKDKIFFVNKFFDKNKDLRCVYDLPIAKDNKFVLKSKKNKLIWSSVFPTSCISIRRKYFSQFLKYVQKNKFSNLEIDTRISIFFKFYYNEYCILKKKLTIYSDDDKKSITAQVKKLSFKWWMRRVDAFEFLKYILKVKKIKFKISFDYLITKLLTFPFKKV